MILVCGFCGCWLLGGFVVRFFCFEVCLGLMVIGVVRFGVAIVMFAVLFVRFCVVRSGVLRGGAEWFLLCGVL